MTVKTWNGIAVASIKTINGIAVASIKTLGAEAWPAGSTYATLNPADKGANVTLSGGNLTASCAGAADMVRATLSKTTGKWSYEVTVGSGAGWLMGVAKATAALTFVGGDADGWGYYGTDGKKYNNGLGAVYGATFTTGNIIRVEYDADSGVLEFFKTNVSQGTIATGWGGLTIFPAVSGDTSGTDVVTVNFGASAFVNSPTAGFNTGWYV